MTMEQLTKEYIEEQYRNMKSYKELMSIIDATDPKSSTIKKLKQHILVSANEFITKLREEKLKTIK